MLYQVDELLMRVNVQLAVDVGDVRLHRAVRESEFLLDVGGVAAACQQAQHIGFARGEAVFASELCTKGVQVRTNVGNRGLCSALLPMVP